MARTNNELTSKESPNNSSSHPDVESAAGGGVMIYPRVAYGPPQIWKDSHWVATISSGGSTLPDRLE
jgi:hypothetical protein